MKILHIVWSLKIGGLERAVFQLLRAFKQSELEADLLVSKGGGLYLNLSLSAGIKVILLNQKRGFDPFIIFRFIRIIRKYDAIHFHCANPLLMFISVVFQKKLFFTQRGGDKDYSVKKRILYKMTGFLLRNWFFVSGNTEHAAKYAKRIYRLKKPVTTTYNGIDFNLLLPTKSKHEILNELGIPSNKKIIIGTSSKLIKWKRQDFLIEALRLVPMKEKYICYIFGDGPEKDSITKLIDQYSLKQNVFLAGNKDYIGNYLQIIDIFVLPSDKSESFGNALVEAMSFGIPCIILDDSTALLEHINEKNGFAVSNIESMAETIIKLIKDADLRQKIGNNAKNIINKYTYENSIYSYRELYTLAGLIK